MSSPRFMYIRGGDQLLNDDIRCLLKEMLLREASPHCTQILGELSIIKPAARLAQNCAKTLVLLTDHDVHTILEDGLMPEEAAALLELDENNYSFRSRIAARKLLNVKERWFMVSGIRGFFRKNRETTEGFLQIEE